MKTKLLTMFAATVLWIGFFSLPVGQTGCAALNTPSAKSTEVVTLKVLGASRDTAMKVAAQLYKDGKLSDAQWVKLRDLHDKFQGAYNLAVDAVKGDTSTFANADMLALFGELSALILSYQTPPSP
jgi:hypothetical protein